MMKNMKNNIKPRSAKGGPKAKAKGKGHTKKQANKQY